MPEPSLRQQNEASERQQCDLEMKELKGRAGEKRRCGQARTYVSRTYPADAAGLNRKYYTRSTSLKPHSLGM